MNKSFICIDDFYEDQDSVRAFALEQDYETSGNYHIRTAPHMTDSVEKIITDALNLNQTYNFNGQYKCPFNTLQLMIEVDTRWYNRMGNRVLYLTPDLLQVQVSLNSKKEVIHDIQVIKIWTSTLINVHKT